MSSGDKNKRQCPEEIPFVTPPRKCWQDGELFSIFCGGRGPLSREHSRVALWFHSGGAESADDMSFREISLKLSLPWISFIRVRQSSSTDAPGSSRLHGRKDNQNRPNLSLVRAIRMTCRRGTEFEVYPFTVVFQQFGMDLVSVHQLVMRSNEVHPQSNLICRTGPRSAWECLKVFMNASVSRALKVSMNDTESHAREDNAISFDFFPSFLH